MAPAPRGESNRLIYLLWVAGACGVIAIMFPHLNNPVAKRDFTPFWIAGKLAASGHAAQAYDLATVKVAAKSYASASVTIEFLYPPHVLLIAAPLSMIPLTVSYFAWEAISVLLFYVAARPYLPDGMPRLLAVLTPAALLNVAFGQISLFFGALWLWCFRGSAIAAALLTIKSHLAIPAAPEVVRKGLVIRTAAAVFAILLLSIGLFGLETWRAFFEGAAAHLKATPTTHYPNWYVQMTTPYLGYGVAGWLAFAAVATALLVRRFNAFAAATAAFLISPYGFHYDMTVVCLGFGVLLFRHWRTLPAWQTLVCALAFLSPVIVRAGTWLVPPLLLGGLYVMTTSSAAEDHSNVETAKSKDLATF